MTEVQEDEMMPLRDLPFSHSIRAETGRRGVEPEVIMAGDTVQRDAKLDSQ